MKKIFILCLLFCVLSLPALTVVREGKSDYIIVISPKAEKASHAAALDLQEYIFKATGAKLPIVRENKAGKRPAFRVGYIKVDTPEGFVVKVQGKDIHISGNDTPGDPYNNHWAHGSRTGTWLSLIHI